MKYEMYVWAAVLILLTFISYKTFKNAKSNPVKTTQTSPENLGPQFGSGATYAEMYAPKDEAYDKVDTSKALSYLMAKD